MRQGAPETIDQALATIASWEGEERSEHLARASDLDDQIARLREEVLRLTEQLTGLQDLRRQMQNAADDAASGVAGRAYTLVFDVLGEQARQLARRAREVVHMRAERRAALDHALRASDAAPLVQEYEQFVNTVAPTLERLPESYRTVMMAHHRVVVEKLRRWVWEWLAGTSQVADTSLSVDICYAFDAPPGEAGVLVVVLPVVGAVYHEWEDREEDVQLALAARVVQALYESFAEAGPEGAEVVAGIHNDLLVLEVDVTDAPDGLPAVLEERCERIFALCRDLVGAGVRPVVQRVPVDYLFPPVVDDDTEETIAPIAIAVGVGDAG